MECRYERTMREENLQMNAQDSRGEAVVSDDKALDEAF